MIIRSHHRYFTPDKGEVNTKPSLTVPNMVPSLSKMLEIYVRGDTVQIFNGVYDDSDMPDVSKLSAPEKAQMALDIKQGIIEQQKKLVRAKERTIDLPTPQDSPREEPADIT